MTGEINLSNYLFLLILLLIFYVPIRAIVLLAKKKKYSINPLREAGMLFFSIYSFFVYYSLICPYFEVSFYDEYRIIEMDTNSFMPFDSIMEAIGEIMGASIFTGLGSLLGPILIVLPTGFLMALLWEFFEEKLLWTTIISLVIGSLVQLPQIYTKRGFCTDDIILFAVGGLLGALLLRFVDKFAHNKYKFRLKEK